MTCVYCRKQSLEPFPAEHVMPQMFGRFKNNLTLDCVCGECNNKFSRLELSFGRDSAEAIERLRHGLKPMEEASQVGRKRMRDTFLDVPGFHEGSRVTLVSHGDRLGSAAAPQVGFKQGEGKPIWIDEDELTEEKIAPFREGYLRIVLGPTDEAISRVEEKLKALGLVLTDPQPLEAPAPDGAPLDVMTTYTLDEEMMRVITKIAFNYATFVAGAEFMLGADFDEIREFVLSGRIPRWEPVVAKSEPILADETFHWRRNKLHLLTVRWNDRTKSLLGQVSFFNRFNYWVALCFGYQGAWKPIKQGHAFSLSSRNVQPLAVRN